MNTLVKESFKIVIADRLLAGLLLLFVVTCLLLGVYVGISLQPSDLQVAVHYTAYGETNFYREKWYYLIQFIILGLVMAIGHSALVVKMYLQGRRQIALLFLSLSFLLLLVVGLVARLVLKIAFL